MLILKLIEDKFMSVSVIIPIYNSQTFLNDLFGALNKVRFDDNDEVLLIDNGSTDTSADICLANVTNYPNLYKYYRYVDKAGSYAARNFAVNKAKGRILVFTDSDTKPVSNWIQGIKSSISEGCVIAGKISLEIVEHNIWEYYDFMAHLNSEKEFLNSNVATANMAVLKEDFVKVGFFEDRFSGGDYEWSTRAVSKGLKINYCPDIMVSHPTRKTFEQIMNKECRIAYGVGNHYDNLQRHIGELVIIFFLKIFKFDTNYRYSKYFYLKNFSIKEIFYFNVKYIYVRIGQLKSAIKGYRHIDPRIINLK